MTKKINNNNKKKNKQQESEHMHRATQKGVTCCFLTFNQTILRIAEHLSFGSV